MPDEQAIFDAARQIADPAARRTYVEDACGPDQRLRRRVETLLRAHEGSDSFLNQDVDVGLGHAALDLADALTPPGTVIGRYTLRERIGEGGYGTVFRAEQTSPVRRTVALKLVKAGMDSRQVVARFDAERQALALMDHPNIAKVHDAGVTETGRPYFVMELVEGAPITKYCDERRLTPRRRLELFVQVCQAVQHAHQKGVIHRDLKPTNVLVAQYDDKPLPKVIDFGVAKATGARLTEQSLHTGLGDVIGTPEYMSPEQAELNPLDVDTRSDIYSLGVLLYELLTGTTPIEHKRVKEAALLEVLRVIREEDPPRPSTRLTATAELPSIAANRGVEPKKLNGLVKGELDWIVMKALEKDRRRRYETANGLARDVERYLADEPVQACPPGMAYRLRKFIRRNKAAIATAVLVAGVLVAATVTSLWQKREAVLARAAAEVSEHSAVVSKGEAERQAAEARRQNEVAQRRLADSVVAEARLLVTGGRYGEAKIKLAEATQTYGDVGDEPVAADLLLLEVMRTAPPPLSQLSRIPLSAPQSIALLPGGRSAIWRVGRPAERQFWAEEVDLRTSVVGRTFRPDTGVFRLMVSGDGRLMLTSDTAEPFGIGVWDVQQAKPLRRYTGHKAAIIGLALSGDARRAASLDTSGQVHIWDPQTASADRQINPRPGTNLLALSRDGRRVATAAPKEPPTIWDADSGQALYGLGDGAVSMAFSNDGRSLLIGGGQRASIWDLETRAKLGVFTEPLVDRVKVSSVAFLPGDRQILAGMLDYQARLRNISTGETERVLSDGIHNWFDASVSADGTYAATVSLVGPVMHWRLLPAVVEATASIREATGVAASADGRTAIFSTAKGKRLVDLETGLLLREMPDAGGRVSPDGTRMVQKTDSDDVVLRDGRTWNPIHQWPGLAGKVDAISFSPDGWRAAYRSGDTYNVWDLQAGRLVCQYKDPSSDIKRGVTTATTFTRDGTRVISSSVDGALRVWDAATGEERATLAGHHEKASRSVTRLLMLNDRQLLSAGYDATIRLWDLETRQELRRFEGHTNYVFDVAATRDGQLLASASNDGTVRVWETATGRELARYQGSVVVWGGAVYGVALSPDGRFLLSTTHPFKRDLKRPARLREFARKLPEARRTLRSNPHDAASLQVLGEWYYFHGIWDWAIEFLESARANGGARVSSLMLARCHAMLGNREAARREFRDAMRRGEAPSDYLELCIAAVDRMRPDVISRDRSWIWQHTVDPDAWNEDPAGILEVCRRYVEEEPKYATSWQFLGWALYRSGDYRASIDALEKSIRIQGGGGDPWQWFFLAMAHHKLGEEDLALAWHGLAGQGAIERYASDLGMQTLRAEAMQVLGLPTRWPWQPAAAGPRVYQRLLKMYGDSPEVRRQLRWVEDALGGGGESPATAPATQPAAATKPTPRSLSP